MAVGDWTVYFRSVFGPKDTPVTPVKAVPVISTEVPPAAGPVDGLIPLTCGGVGMPPPQPPPLATTTGRAAAKASIRCLCYRRRSGGN
jgi:hypothetical protein